MGMLVMLVTCHMTSQCVQYYVHLGCVVIHNFMRTKMTFVKVSQYPLADSDSQ